MSYKRPIKCPVHCDLCPWGRYFGLGLDPTSTAAVQCTPAQSTGTGFSRMRRASVYWSLFFWAEHLIQGCHSPKHHSFPSKFYKPMGWQNIPGSLSRINYEISDFNFSFVTERCHFLRWLWGWRSHTWSCGAEERKRSMASSSSSSSSCTRGSWLTLKPRLWLPVLIPDRSPPSAKKTLDNNVLILVHCPTQSQAYLSLL